jgi:hypothetical protein
MGGGPVTLSAASLTPNVFSLLSRRPASAQPARYKSGYSSIELPSDTCLNKLPSFATIASIIS